LEEGNICFGELLVYIVFLIVFFDSWLKKYANRFMMAELKIMQ
jgi:hypothetical protein